MRAHSFFLEPFCKEGRIRAPRIVLFAVVNAAILANAILHDSMIGFDAASHMSYAQTLASGRLPGPDDSHEFFSAPLPYLVPAAVLRVGGSPRAAAKAIQIANAVLALVMTFTLLKIARLIRPGDGAVPFWTLGLMGLLPVFYKTFAIARGEPWVAAFAVLSAWQALCLIRAPAVRRALALGLCVGALALSRQWGAPAAMGIAAGMLPACRPSRGNGWRRLRLALLAAAVAFVIGGWFYLLAWARYGTLTPFNRAPLGDSPEHARIELWRSGDASILFRAPVREALSNRALPIFYAEMWGDYWRYFLVYSRVERTGAYLNGLQSSWVERRAVLPDGLITNREKMTRYLGRVCRVSIVPTLLFLAGLTWAGLEVARRRDPSSALALSLLVILFSAAVYAWFVLTYPGSGTGDTVKASYIFHVFPFAALCGAGLLASLRERRPLAYRLLAVLLLLCALHNAPACVTRFVPW